jgi:hypothetical protein
VTHHLTRRVDPEREGVLAGRRVQVDRRAVLPQDRTDMAAAAQVTDDLASGIYRIRDEARGSTRPPGWRRSPHRGTTRSGTILPGCRQADFKPGTRDAGPRLLLPFCGDLDLTRPCLNHHGARSAAAPSCRRTRRSESTRTNWLGLGKHSLVEVRGTPGLRGPLVGFTVICACFPARRSPVRPSITPSC